MASDIRGCAKGRGRFDDFGRGDFARAAAIFRTMDTTYCKLYAECQRIRGPFPIASLGKNDTKPARSKSARLSLELVDAAQTKMKNSKGPRIEEVQIPREMARWAPSMAALTGALVHGRDIANHFAIELPRGLNESPSRSPCATGDQSAGPWVPTAPLLRGRMTFGSKCNPTTKGHMDKKRRSNLSS